MSHESGIALSRVKSVEKGPDGEDILMPDVEAMKRAKELRQLAPDSNLVQLLVASGDLMVAFFKMIMASMLSVFVPQQCPNSGSETTPICFNSGGLVPTDAELSLRYNTSTHECTFEENFQDLTSWNKFVLAWNFITLAVMSVHYVLTWRREKFLISKLEVSLTDSKIHLKEVIGQYPHIQDRLKWYNRRVFEISIFGMICQLVNVLVSAVLIFRDYYAGYKSVTSFFTSVLITATIMKNCAENTYIGIKHSLALSCISYEPISYNAIDQQFKLKHPE